jgi:hypothetical protein
MPVSGDLGTLDIADLLGWIQVRAKTGQLLLGRGATEKRLRFDGGRLASSTSNDPRETLGQALVRDQLVSEEALFGALLRQERERALLGEMLVAEGLLTAEQVRHALEHTTEEIVYDVFLWSDGTFTYEDQAAPSPDPFRLDMDVGLVIDEGLHRREQWAELCRRLPSSNVRFSVLSAGGAGDAVERAIVALAAAGRTLGSISLETRRSRYDTALRVDDLVERGVLACDPPVLSGGEPDAVALIQALLASAAEMRRQNRFDGALALYEEALTLDRLNQEAKKGLLSAVEEKKSYRLATRLPQDKVPALRVGAVALTRQSFDPQEGFVLSRINGEWSLGAILKLCPLPETEALTIFARLLERGVIELR